MKLDNKGYLMIAEHEGLSLKPYLCPSKIPTIGHGNTYYENGKKVTMSDPAITKDRAFELLKLIADKFAFSVNSVLKKPVNQNQFNSLVSFTYNLGIVNLNNSTLLKKVNFNPDDLTIRDEFMKWNKANGKVLTGLTARREKEAKNYFNV